MAPRAVNNNSVQRLNRNVVDIVTALVTHNHVAAADLPYLIQGVHAALVKAAGAKDTALIPPGNAPQRPPDRPDPQPDRIICLECGQAFRTLRRHLSESHGLTCMQYRRRFELPFDYPLIASDYIALRREIAFAANTKKKITVSETKTTKTS